jgi:hypothetical protein
MWRVETQPDPYGPGISLDENQNQLVTFPVSSQ